MYSYKNLIIVYFVVSRKGPPVLSTILTKMCLPKKKNKKEANRLKIKFAKLKHVCIK